jgi:predicted nucleic acid-binding protein
VSAYLDANVLVALFVTDPLNRKADISLRKLSDVVLISDFSAAEFASVIARRARTRELDTAEARAAFSNFDEWCTRHVQRVEVESGDVANAASLLRRLDLTLRTPDAIHIAMTRRVAARLLTFDQKMAAAARSLGVPLVPA